MTDSHKFELAKFEHLVYTRQHEAAVAELFALLAFLDRSQGSLGEVGQHPSGNARGDIVDSYVATRIAAAVAALFADTGFQLTNPGFERIIPLQRWLTILFGASPLLNADHVIRQLNQRGYNERDQITLKDGDLLKFALLYSLDSAIPLQADAFWAKDRKLTASLFIALLASRIAGTREAMAKKEQLLAWLPTRLRELSLDDFPGSVLHDVWMHCSYAHARNKHDIKRAINELIRERILAQGFTDVTQSGLDPGSIGRGPGGKPVLLCIMEWFYSNHSIYRTHSVSMQALREKYHLVGISMREASDETSRRVFDEVHVLSRSQPVFDTMRQIRQLVGEKKPAIVYYPSAGMFLETVFLVNLRLAPIQIVALGHPATTHSRCIDYVVVEEDYVGDKDCFSEKLVAVPKESIPYRPPANCPKIPPQIREAPDPVRIVVAATVMKINHAFLYTLRRIAETAKTAVEFHFLSGQAVGLSKVYLQNLIKQVLDPWAVVYPHLNYEPYLQQINRCDMFVNPFPFGNTNGIVDTVRQGLPGVCLTGAEVHTHIDEGLFRRLGLPEWLVAKNTDEYVNAAVRLIDNHQLRVSLSRDLLKRDPDAILFQGNPSLFTQAIAWLHENHHRLAKIKGQVLRPIVKQTS